ncbi:hypothetical protein [Actinomadura sp. DC4]|uniref:hypothetical protein n=1 Tax=Actinomadura sp. DC4 TaxID=3055069 RepID=UPI0025B26682|nr:hypothetical protein [Actinomadura sp. DC4]MDN3353849.1 hypothetical protein [Actinomadura sp. DC4]
MTGVRGRAAPGARRGRQSATGRGVVRAVAGKVDALLDVEPDPRGAAGRWPGAAAVRAVLEVG